MNNLDKIDKNLGWHKFSCVRINVANSKEHELEKFNLAYDLLKEGHQIATEVKLTNGRIVDLVDLTEGKFYEFETNDKINKDDSITIKVNRGYKMEDML